MNFKTGAFIVSSDLESLLLN